MDRVTLNELKELSKELLGASSRWQKLTREPRFVESVKPNGTKVQKATWLNEEEVLLVLREMKRKKEEDEAIQAVQKAAGMISK